MVLKKYSNKFTDDFEKNKKILNEVIEIKSKKIKNQVAGYITTIMRRKSLS